MVTMHEKNQNSLYKLYINLNCNFHDNFSNSLPGFSVFAAFANYRGVISTQMIWDQLLFLTFSFFLPPKWSFNHKLHAALCEISCYSSVMWFIVNCWDFPEGPTLAPTTIFMRTFLALGGRCFFERKTHSKKQNKTKKISSREVSRNVKDAAAVHIKPSSLIKLRTICVWSIVSLLPLYR